MRFSIVTPCYNAERYVAETVQSILGQTALLSGRATLEYIVVDGQSTDRTVQIVRECTAGFEHGTVQIISEPDHGMYDALAKGLKLTTGEICAYLNADDLYSPYAFDIIMDILEQHPIQWLTGLRVIYNEKSHPVHAHLPFVYRSSLITHGLYNGFVLEFIQQESTFWRRGLLQSIDFHKLAQLRLAGDYYLWHQFARQADLKIVEAYLGGFRYHKGQQSENRTAYVNELRLIADPPRLTDYALAAFDKISMRLPGRLTQRWRRNTVLKFNHDTQQWQWK